MPSDERLGARPTGLDFHRRIFISSSSIDLFAHREAVVQAIHEMDQDVITMEYFGARNADATEASLHQLAKADLVIFLVAWRYGTIPLGKTQSVTHIEYEAAKEWELPRLVFLADPATEVDDILFPPQKRNIDHHQQLLDFRAELGSERVAAFFTTPDNLAARVGPAIISYLLTEQYAELMRSSGLRLPRDLPPRAPGFVGREQEVAELCQQLRAGQSTGLSAAVAGMAGVGKSALAAEVVHRLVIEPGLYPGGITFVRCDGQTKLAGLAWVYDQLLAAWDASLTPEKLAQATTVEAGVEVRERALRTWLRPKDVASSSARTLESEFKGQQAFVLLDNVESELPLTRLLDTLASLGLTALVTSRNRHGSPRLHIRSIDVLNSEAAAQLFAERLQEGGGTWESARDQKDTIQVVNALGNLPLAVELAAARAALSHLSINDLVSELHTANHLGQLRDPLDPTRSVWYAFGKSLRQLAPRLQLEFAALSLPAGPDWPRSIIENYFANLNSLVTETPDDNVESHERVIPVHDELVPPLTTHEQAEVDLEALVARSLVSLVPSDDKQDSQTDRETYEGHSGRRQTRRAYGQLRVRVHPLLREFTATTWTKQLDTVRQHGRTALLAAVYEFIKAHETPTRDDFAVLAHEEALIVGAVDDIVTNHPGLDTQTPEAVQRLLYDVVNDLFNYLTIGGHWRLGLRLYPYQLAVCKSLGDRNNEAGTYNNLGMLQHYLGQPDEARFYYVAALIIEREEGYERGEATTLNNLGELASNVGQPVEASQYFEQALIVQRKVGSRKDEAATLNNLGMLAFNLGKFSEARRHYEQALTIHSEMENHNDEAATLNNLGLLAHTLGHFEEAQRYYEQALAILHEVGNRRMESTTLNNPGGLARSLNQPEDARRYYEQAFTIQRETGERRGEAITLSNLGLLFDDLGQVDTALTYNEQALIYRREVGDRNGEIATLNNLGVLHRKLGHVEEASCRYEQALDVAREVEDLHGAAVSLNNLGLLAQSVGRLKDAREYYEEALSIFESIGVAGETQMVRYNLASLNDTAG